jgi:heme iron utilization protein
MSDKIEMNRVDNSERASVLIRTAFKASLATLSKANGSPYPSLVLMATMPDGSPIMLLSGLALHTHNLLADSRVGLLIDGTGVSSVSDGDANDPMAGDRISLAGTISETSDAIARRRFLARHPLAAGYADFGDFGFYRMAVTGAHLIRGFGLIVDLPPHLHLSDVTDAEDLISNEPALLTEFQSSTFGRSEAGMVRRLVGIDPGGIDLAAGRFALRIVAVQRMTTAQAARLFVRQHAD